MPHARSETAGITICCILAPILTLRAEVFAKIGPADIEQGPHDIRSHRINSHNAARPRSAQDAGENRFCLIVSRVRDGDFGAMPLGNCALEEVISCAPARVFEVPVISLRYGRNIFVRGKQFQSMRSSELSNEGCVSIRSFPAQTVIQMQYAQTNAKLVLQIL
jgi:hypothetical protein